MTVLRTVRPRRGSAVGPLRCRIASLKDSVTLNMTKTVPKGIWQKWTDNLAEGRERHLRISIDVYGFSRRYAPNDLCVGV